VAFISFEAAITDLRENYVAKVREALPIAGVAALTRTAVKCRDEMKKHIQFAFDRPTPYAVNAPRAVPANFKTMSSAVLLRDFGNTAAGQYLGPEIHGAARGQKRFEKALQFVRILKPGGFADAGSGAALDAYGNQRSGEIVKILSVLKAFSEVGYRANRAKGWGKASRVGQIFAVRQGTSRGGLKPGVYRRTADGKVVCLMKFLARTPNYRVRLPFDDLVASDAAKFFPVEMDRAVTEFTK
jgi:hypothetical protein